MDDATKKAAYDGTVATRKSMESARGYGGTPPREVGDPPTAELNHDAQKTPYQLDREKTGEHRAMRDRKRADAMKENNNRYNEQKKSHEEPGLEK